MILNANFDPTKVITGNEGQVFLTLADNSQIYLADTQNFQAQLNANAADLQPGGTFFQYAILTSIAINLTLTQIVIRDDVMLKKLYDNLKQGLMPSFDFQGKFSRNDGQEQRQVFRKCIPVGTVDLYNLTPGEVITRPWAFRANAIPELLSYFK